MGSSKLHRVETTEDYWADLEEITLDDGQQVLFFHVRFSRFSKAALRDAVLKWHLFRKFVTAPIYAVAGEDDGPKWCAFVSLFGFHSTGSAILLNNGESRELYLSTVNERREHSHTNPTTAAD